MRIYCDEIEYRASEGENQTKNMTIGWEFRVRLSKKKEGFSLDLDCPLYSITFAVPNVQLLCLSDSAKHIIIKEVLSDQIGCITEYYSESSSHIRSYTQPVAGENANPSKYVDLLR